MLQEVPHHGDWPVKLWRLLPSPPHHDIVHFLVNSHVTMYGLFQRANIQNIFVSGFLFDEGDNFIGIDLSVKHHPVLLRNNI